MSLNLKISITGAAQAIQDLNNAVNNGELAIRDAVQKGCLMVEATAKRNLRDNDSVDTGRLINSITTQVNFKKGEGTVGKAGSDVKYAPYVEIGTGLYSSKGTGRKTPWRYFYRGRKAERGFRITTGSKPKPYLFPALRSNFDQISRMIKDAVKAALEKKR